MNETASKLTASEAAELLDMSIRHVQRLAKSGELAGEKFGRDWCFRRVDIIAYASKRRKPGRPKRSV